MATSSAIRLGDLALTWSFEIGAAEISLIDSDLAVDGGLETAVILSLFTDRRAEDDDVPPSGNPSDRRGWWADQLLGVAGDRYGSRLWLLDRSKLTNETALRAREYAIEALAWMIEDKVVAGVDVATSIDKSKTALLLSVSLQRPGRDAVTFKFSRVWNNL